MARKLRTGEVAEEDVFGPAVMEDELQEEGEKGESVESSLVGDDDDEFDDFDDDDEEEEEEADADAEPAPEVSEEATPDPEPVAVAEPVVAEIEWDEAKERKADEEAWFAELQEARKEMEKAESVLDGLKEGIKIAKAEYNIAQQTLLSLAESGPTYRKKPVPVPAAKAAPSPAPTQPQPESDSDPKPEPIAEVDDWQSISTASLLEGIEGLGAKKRDTLIETFPTLGKLEEARAEASKEFLPFKAKLPKGIGEKIASDLEEKMLQAIARRTN